VYVIQQNLFTSNKYYKRGSRSFMARLIKSADWVVQFLPKSDMDRATIIKHRNILAKKLESVLKVVKI
jgi:hypothetical protein